jgi:hypothetical protein
MNREAFKQKIQNIIYNKYFKIGLFITFILTAISFFIFQRGIWWYVDGMYMPHNRLSNELMLRGGLNIFSTDHYSSYFGIAKELFASQKVLKDIFLYNINSILGYGLGQIVFFITFYLTNFIFSKKLFDIIKKNKNNFYIALFFTFNPWALWLCNKSGVAFSYTALVMLIYGIILFYKKQSKSSYFIITLSSYLLLLYVRTALMNILLLLVLGLYILTISKLKKEIWDFIKEHKSKVWILIFCILAINSPKLLILSYFLKGSLPWLNQFNDNYVGWLDPGQYDISFLFNFNNINGIFDFISNPFHMILGALIFLLLFGSLLLGKVKNHKKEILFFTTTYLVGLFSQMAILITNNTDKLLFLYGTIFVFAAKIIPYGTFILIQIFPIILFLFYLTQTNNKKIIMNILIIVYLFSSIIMFINFDNYELEKINIEKINSIDHINNNGLIKDNFHSLEEESSIFLPATDYILLEDFPYPIDIRFAILGGREFLSSNKRISLPEEIELRNKIEQLGEKLKIYNVKNFYLIKGKNPEVKYDFFTTPGYFNYEKYTQEKFFELNKSKELALNKENKYYYLFKFRNSEEYDFLIYVPQTIKSEKALFNESFDEAFMPVFVNNDEIENLNSTIDKNIQIEYKKDFLDPTKYFVKISNIGNKEFILQFNRRYSKNWKIKLIDEKIYENKECLSNFKNFEISKNTYCSVKNNLFSFEDSKNIIFKPELAAPHFKGNLIGNGWKIDPSELENGIDQKEIYLIITYKSQIYYTLLVIVSLAPLFFIGIFVLIEKIKKIKK